MKLPSLKQQPVGEFASGNIAQPNRAAMYDAAGELIGKAGMLYTEYRTSKIVNEIDEASGKAANELSELRARLENGNTIPVEEVPDDMVTELEVSVTDGVGGRKEISKPFVFTHEVSDEMWEKGSQEIVDYYASTIKNVEARAKFIGEITERYIAPGTGAIIKANILRVRAYGQAQAERAIEGAISSNAPSDIRESQAKEIIARQFMLGQNPVWVENQLAALGPNIDQMDVQNAILGAQAVDEIDQIEEGMWTDGNRMSPEQMRVMSSQMDSRRRDFLVADKQRQDESADQMFMDYHNPDAPVSEMDVARAVQSQSITREAGWTFINGMKAGTTVKASDPFTLSRYRGEIFRLQYTGGEGNLRVSDKAKLLKLMITRGSMGLNPNGTPTGQPATISGVDALTLNREIESAVKLATENKEYKNAFLSVLMWTKSSLDLEGQLTTAFEGNQHQVEAAVAFKNALDNYMDTYGADAKPIDFYEANKDAYDPRNFSSGINGSFLKTVPQALPFMNLPDNREIEFTPAQQEDFIMWLGDNIEVLGAERYTEISSLFDQYYRGKGIAPDGGALMLEPDDPLYRQFQQAIPNE